MNREVMMSSKLIALIALPLFALGCDYHDDDRHHDHGYQPVDDQPSLVSAFIDSGAGLEGIEPGFETGLFITYDGAGRWHAHAVCDFELSAYPCSWDVIAIPSDGVIIDLFEDDAEPEDFVSTDVDFTFAHMQTLTASDTDGMFVDTNLDVSVTFDVFLDDVARPDLVFWVTDGVVNPGAPSNPIELVPR